MSIRIPFRMTPTRLMATIASAAIAGGVALAAFATEEGAPAPAPLPHAGPHHPPLMGGLMLPRGPMLDHLLDQIDATTQQRSQVHRIVDGVTAQAEAGMASARADHEQMMQLFAQPVVDAAAVEAVRQRLLARQDADSRVAMQAMLQLSQVLTADQRVRLQSLVRQARAYHHHPPMDGASGAAPMPAGR